MVLLPLEPEECLTDSPYFRANLHSHEAELENTGDALKGLLKESRKLLSAIIRKYSQDIMVQWIQCLVTYRHNFVNIILS